ncbi:MAG: tetratricopeptide repeat protein [Candidatus Electrothrix sp. GM3_4]|nr:tetratricopeptide repeat protein [Candidatus Electrothrix sp. GM3_4]
MSSVKKCILNQEKPSIQRIYEKISEYYVAALQYFDQALGISRETKNKGLESKVLNNISQVYNVQGKRDLALEYLQQSLIITQQLGDCRGEAVILNNLAGIHEAKGDYPAALKQYEEALAIAKEIGAKAEVAILSSNIGRIYEDQGDSAKAEHYLSRAVELMEQLEHPKLDEWRKALEVIRTKLCEQRN